jgi:hypothetical protein
LRHAIAAIIEREAREDGQPLAISGRRHRARVDGAPDPAWFSSAAPTATRTRST